MIFKAALNNRAHPEYGDASIPFPIPSSEYDHTIEMLDAIGFGDALAQDCRVVEITSFYDLERVGKSHSLTINGTMPIEEYKKVDGQSVALDLIQSGNGVVTPYGVGDAFPVGPERARNALSPLLGPQDCPNAPAVGRERRLPICRGHGKR